MLEKIWQNFGQSTFTHLGRNDRIVDWALKLREERELRPIENIILLGSGIIEPFTIAALPRARAAKVRAVEINPQLLQLGEDIKAARAIPWQKIAEVSLNPGRPNRDLKDRAKLAFGLKRLEKLGSRENLGLGFNEDRLQVAQEVASRVQFVDQDALSALRDITDADIIGDFFLQVNINKDESPNLGLNYTRQLVDAASQALASDGLYLIGDTGKNLPVTLGHLARTPRARLHICSLVHAANLGDRFITSSYLVVSKMEEPDSEEMIEAARQNIANKPGLRELKVIEENLSLDELSAITRTRLNLAYVLTRKASIAWNTVDDLQQSLSQLIPEPDSQFSQTIILPAQKSELEYADLN